MWTHGDLRSPGREFTRERSLRKKGPHGRPTSATIQSPPTFPGVQPAYPEDDEDEHKSLTPEERALARKRAKKQAKSAKRKALKSQEQPKNPRKREDRRREDEVAAIEASMAAASLKASEEGEEHEVNNQSQDRQQQRRRSSNTNAVRPAKPRKTSSSTQGGGGGLKSPKIGTEPEEALTPGGTKRGSPFPNTKTQAAYRQYNLEEGMHERAHDIDAQMKELAKYEQLSSESKSGRLAKGLEEIQRMSRERKQNEALRGVVDAAQERYEDEKLAKFYNLK